MKDLVGCLDVNAGERNVTVCQLLDRVVGGQCNEGMASEIPPPYAGLSRQRMIPWAGEYESADHERFGTNIGLRHGAGSDADIHLAVLHHALNLVCRHVIP
jgi:hypothetical protein